MHCVQKSFSISRLSLAPCLLAFFVLLTGCEKKVDLHDDVRPVRAIRLVASQQQVMAEYAGSVRPRVEANLGFRVSGKISTRKVDVGALVKPGQVLMQLDPADLLLAKRQAEGNFKAAQSTLQLATNELKRYEGLYKTNAVSQSMLEAKVAAQAAAQGNFEQAQAVFNGQSNQAVYANLIAASGGVVTAIYAEVGQVINAGIPVIQVAQLGEMEIAIGIPENNVDIISHANSVSIHLWANPQEAITGKIREVSPVADAATRTFLARVSMVNPSPKVIAAVKMGMTASVQFALNTQGAFVKVPLTALFQEKGSTAVWVVEKGTVKLVPVTIIGVSGNDLLLSSGVSVGQTVVTAGVHLLKPGQRVTLLDEAAAVENKNESYLTAQSLLKQDSTAVTPAMKGAAK